MIRDIEGRRNHSVKLARRLQRKKYRRERALMVVEGLDLLCIAVEAGAEIGDVLVRRDVFPRVPEELRRRAEAGAVDIGLCTEETMGYASSLGGAADVIFTCRQPVWSLGDLTMEYGVTVYLDAVGDPGNVGTLMRSCVGFGALGLVSSPGTADPFSPKAMRAGMGAQFLLPVVTEVTQADIRARLEKLTAAAGRVPHILVADPHEGVDLREIRCRDGLLLVLGSERYGAGGEWAAYDRVSIPQARFDSLNVAMAGTILLYELSGSELSGSR